MQQRRARTGLGLRLPPGGGPAGDADRLRRSRPRPASVLGRDAALAASGRSKGGAWSAPERPDAAGAGGEANRAGRSCLRPAAGEDRTLVVRRRRAGPSAPAATAELVAATA